MLEARLENENLWYLLFLLLNKHSHASLMCNFAVNTPGSTEMPFNSLHRHLLSSKARLTWTDASWTRSTLCAGCMKCSLCRFQALTVGSPLNLLVSKIQMNSFPDDYESQLCFNWHAQWFLKFWFICQHSNLQRFYPENKVSVSPR